MSCAKRPLVALACTALVAVGCASPRQAVPVDHVSNVPWVDRPAPAYVAPLPPKPTAMYQPCRAGQLLGRAGRGGPAAGTVFQEVRLTNRSHRSCTLTGGPTAVTGLLASGGTATLTRLTPTRVTLARLTPTRVAKADGFNLVGPGPANLRPGQSGWLTLAYADGCTALTSGGKANYRTLFVVVGGGPVRVDFPAELNLVCGLEASTFGAPQPASPSSRSPLNALTAAVVAPAAFSLGATARYAVTLVNRTGVPVRLAPCPSYTEYLGVSSGPDRFAQVTRHYYLNCAAVRRIPAHGSVTFAMYLPVPGATGQAKLDWQLQGTDVATAVAITISRRPE